MLSTLDLASYAAVVAVAIVYGYVAFSAFAIGRTLSDRVYRRQAVGMGALTIIIAWLTAIITLGPTNSTNPVIFIGAFLSYYATFVGFYYWIDASIRAARLTDPLVRDTLHWSRLRIVFWAYDIGATVVFLLVGLFYSVKYSTAPSWIVLLILGPLFIMLFSGVVALPIVSHRSKDKVLKKHLDWFGVYTIVVLAFVFIWGGFVGATNLDSALVTAVGGYFLYRSTKSLVPLYAFRDEPAPGG